MLSSGDLRTSAQASAQTSADAATLHDFIFLPARLDGDDSPARVKIEVRSGDLSFVGEVDSAIVKARSPAIADAIASSPPGDVPVIHVPHFAEAMNTLREWRAREPGTTASQGDRDSDFFRCQQQEADAFDILGCECILTCGQSPQVSLSGSDADCEEMSDRRCEVSSASELWRAGLCKAMTLAAFLVPGWRRAVLDAVLAKKEFAGDEYEYFHSQMLALIFWLDERHVTPESLRPGTGDLRPKAAGEDVSGIRSRVPWLNITDSRSQIPWPKCPDNSSFERAYHRLSAIVKYRSEGEGSAFNSGSAPWRTSEGVNSPLPGMEGTSISEGEGSAFNSGSAPWRTSENPFTVDLNPSASATNDPFADELLGILVQRCDEQPTYTLRLPYDSMERGEHIERGKILWLENKLLYAYGSKKGKKPLWPERVAGIKRTFADIGSDTKTYNCIRWVIASDFQNSRDPSPARFAAGEGSVRYYPGHEGPLSNGLPKNVKTRLCMLNTWTKLWGVWDMHSLDADASGHLDFSGKIFEVSFKRNTFFAKTEDGEIGIWRVGMQHKRGINPPFSFTPRLPAVPSARDADQPQDGRDCAEPAPNPEGPAAKDRRRGCIRIRDEERATKPDAWAPLSRPPRGYYFSRGFVGRVTASTPACAAHRGKKRSRIAELRLSPNHDAQGDSDLALPNANDPPRLSLWLTTLSDPSCAETDELSIPQVEIFPDVACSLGMTQMEFSRDGEEIVFVTGKKLKIFSCKSKKFVLETAATSFVIV